MIAGSIMVMNFFTPSLLKSNLGTGSLSILISGET